MAMTGVSPMPAWRQNTPSMKGVRAETMVHAHTPPLQRVKGRQRGGAEFLVFVEGRAVHVAGHEPDALQRAFRQTQKRRLLSHCHPPCSKRGPCICGVFPQTQGPDAAKAAGYLVTAALPSRYFNTWAWVGTASMLPGAETAIAPMALA